MTARKPIVIKDGHQWVLPAGDTLLTPQSSTANASLNLPEGTAPTTPADGDVWTTAAGMFVQIAGATVGPLGSGGGASPANPTATAGPMAINGSATTYMRSDAAPAVQLGSSSQPGIVQVDGTTITASGGVISAVGGGGGWTDLTFGSPVNKFGFGSIRPSNETFALAAGQKLEVDAEVYRTTSAGTSGSVLASADGTNGYYVDSQTDGNIVMYKYVSGSASSLGATGAATSNNYQGVHSMALTVNAVGSSNNIINTLVNFIRLPASNGNYSDTAINLVGTVTIYIDSPDITKCRARARVVG